MKVSIFQNMTSKTPLPGLLEGVADLIRSDKKMATFTQSYRQNRQQDLQARVSALCCGMPL